MTNPEHRHTRLIKTMQIRIYLDKDLYRHLTFQQPHTSAYRYEITTTPGTLHFTGDIGAWTFRRADDMLKFFHTSATTQPNYHYWAEKVQQTPHTNTYEYSETLLHEHVQRELQDTTKETQEAWNRHAEEYDLIYEQEARKAIEEFNHNGYQFLDPWEWDLHAPSHHFTWACHAILHATNTYYTHHKQRLHNSITKDN